MAKMDPFLENQGVKRIRAMVHGYETKGVELERPVVTFTDSERSWESAALTDRYRTLLLPIDAAYELPKQQQNDLLFV